MLANVSNNAGSPTGTHSNRTHARGVNVAVRYGVNSHACAVSRVRCGWFSHPPQRKALKPVVEEGNMPRILSVWPPRMQLAGARGAIRCVVAVAFASSARARCVPESPRLHLARAHGVILSRRVCS